MLLAFFLTFFLLTFYVSLLSKIPDFTDCASLQNSVNSCTAVCTFLAAGTEIKANLQFNIFIFLRFVDF